MPNVVVITGANAGVGRAPNWEMSTTKHRVLTAIAVTGLLYGLHLLASKFDV
jgi:NADP-dependent 3-hydroxy acid dehydrogenase YdfG